MWQCGSDSCSESDLPKPSGNSLRDTKLFSPPGSRDSSHTMTDPLRLPDAKIHLKGSGLRSPRVRQVTGALLAHCAFFENLKLWYRLICVNCSYASLVVSTDQVVLEGD